MCHGRLSALMATLHLLLTPYSPVTLPPSHIFLSSEVQGQGHLWGALSYPQVKLSAVILGVSMIQLRNHQVTLQVSTAALSSLSLAPGRGEERNLALPPQC